MDQFVRVRAVLRERGDAEADGGSDRLGRRLDVEGRLRDGAADPLRDLERLLGRGLGQKERELLAAEACGDVVVAELRPEDLGHAPEHRVAGQMAVVVVDVAEQVEVGHHHRHRTLEAGGAGDLGRERRREVASVVEAGLRVDARLRLQPRHGQRAVHDDERRERGEDEPGIPGPEGGERDAERGQDEVGRDALEREDPAFAEGVVAPEPEDDRDEGVVRRHPRDGACEPRRCEPRVGVRDRRGVMPDDVGSTPGREGVQGVVREVEGLDRPGVALLQPLGDGLGERHQDDELGRQQEHAGENEDRRGVVEHVPRRLCGEQLRHGCREREQREGLPVVSHRREAEVVREGRGGRAEHEDGQVEAGAGRQGPALRLPFADGRRGEPAGGSRRASSSGRGEPARAGAGGIPGHRPVGAGASGGPSGAQLVRPPPRPQRAFSRVDAWFSPIRLPFRFRTPCGEWAAVQVAHDSRDAPQRMPLL